jgi:hypothetical protein
METVLKRFEDPDEIREFEKGRFEIVRVGGMTIGRAVGMVLSGHAVAAYKDGSVVDLIPGTLFYIPPRPHDSWVVGTDRYVSLHFLGADHYAK